MSPLLQIPPDRVTDRIVKRPAALVPTPNLLDYDWLGKDGERRELTYAELARETSRFANALEGLGQCEGERVFILMGRIPELYIALLGALKARCVATPLFSAFGPEPIATRAEIGDARVLVTTTGLYQRKVQGLRARLPGLRHVIVVGAPDDHHDSTVLRWDPLLQSAGGSYTIAPTDADGHARARCPRPTPDSFWVAACRLPCAASMPGVHARPSDRASSFALPQTAGSAVCHCWCMAAPRLRMERRDEASS